MRTTALAVAVLVAAFASGAAEACRCLPSAQLADNPESAKVQVLVRFVRQVPLDAATPTGPAWVEVETKPLRGAGFSRYRWGGSSCDLRLPAEGWFLLLTDGAPETGFNLCTSVLVPQEEAGALLERLRKTVPQPKR